MVMPREGEAPCGLPSRDEITPTRRLQTAMRAAKNPAKEEMSYMKGGGKIPSAREMAKKMTAYFSGYDEQGLPSFMKFAERTGLTLEQLRVMREHAEFDAAWRECNEIRRDYLIDGALCKRLDASFAKFIYSLEFPEESAADGGWRVTVEVLDDGKA